MNSQHMNIQICFLIAFIITQMTMERFFPSMNKIMTFKFIRVAKRFPTNGTMNIASIVREVIHVEPFQRSDGFTGLDLEGRSELIAENINPGHSRLKKGKIGGVPRRRFKGCSARCDERSGEQPLRIKSIFSVS